MATMSRYMHLAGNYLAYAHRPTLWPAMACNIATSWPAGSRMGRSGRR